MKICSRHSSLVQTCRHPEGKIPNGVDALVLCKISLKTLHLTLLFFFFGCTVFVPCCMLAFSSCGRRILFVVERKLQDIQAQWLGSMGLVDPMVCVILTPQPGIERESPTLEDGFLTTRPPRKPQLLLLFCSHQAANILFTNSVFFNAEESTLDEKWACLITGKVYLPL